jgi:hypothetical protein
MAWRVARSLIVLRNQIDATWPGRITASDGTIGDASHTSTSDHAARDFPGWGNDIVTARDISHDPAHGADMWKLAEHLRASRDSRIKYVIWHDQMFSSYSGSAITAWAWRPYSGGYHSHLHVSVVGDSRADGEQPWYIQKEDDVTLTNEQNNALAEGWAVAASLRDGGNVPNTTTNPGGQPAFVVASLKRVEQAQATSAARETATQAAIQALIEAVAAGGGDVETAAILAKIDQVAAAESAAVAALQADLDASATRELQMAARITKLSQALAAAGGELAEADNPV